MLTKRHFLTGALALSAASLSSTSFAKGAQTKKALVIVSLADNEHQGIIPTTAELGDGQNPNTNLYWGALYGVKTYFNRSKDYSINSGIPTDPIKGALESITISSNEKDNVTIDAIAFDGRHQETALRLYYDSLETNLRGYDLVVYVGHNPLMDINPKFNKHPREELHTTNVKTAVLACQSRSFFKAILEDTKAEEYVMTNGNMAPEAYSLDGILQAWMNDEPASMASKRAAEQYAKYQKIPMKNANWLFKAS